MEVKRVRKKHFPVLDKNKNKDYYLGGDICKKGFFSKWYNYYFEFEKETCNTYYLSYFKLGKEIRNPAYALIRFLDKLIKKKKCTIVMNCEIGFKTEKVLSFISKKLQGKNFHHDGLSYFVIKYKERRNYGKKKRLEKFFRCNNKNWYRRII